MSILDNRSETKAVPMGISIVGTWDTDKPIYSRSSIQVGDVVISTNEFLGMRGNVAIEESRLGDTGKEALARMLADAELIYNEMAVGYQNDITVSTDTDSI